MIKRLVTIGLIMAVVSTQLACSTDPDRLAGVDVDYLLWQGKVYTVDEQQPWAEAVAIKDNRIVYVGDNEGARAFVGQHTEVIDLDGKMVTPGFIDTHAHPIWAAGLSGGLRLDMGGNPEQWLEALAEFAEENPELPVLFGFGFSPARFGAKGPTKEMLDAVVPDRPVVLVDDGGHSAWVNSKAFEQAGYDRNTPDPIPGVHYFVRDDQGELTGWCLEQMTFNPLINKLGMFTPQGVVDKAGRIFWLMTSFGTTTVFDAGMSQFEDNGYKGLAELAKLGKLPVRMVTSHMVQSPEHLSGAIERIQHLNKTYGSELVQPRVIKIHNDGTKEASTAALFRDYVGQPGNRGAILFEGETLQNFVVAVDQAGFDIQIHAIGDRAVDEALDAFEAARKANPDSTNRYSIAHAELMRDEDIPRFGQLGVVAQTTPIWFAAEQAIIENTVGLELAAKTFRFKDIEDAGAVLSFGSDFPATAQLKVLSPFQNMETGITRQYAGEPNSVVMPPADQGLSLETMIKGYTLNAAYHLNMEKEIGSLEVGKLADLTVLNENLFEVDTYDIHGVRVHMTMMNGKVTYERSYKSLLAELAMGL